MEPGNVLSVETAAGRSASFVGVEILATADLDRARDFEKLNEHERIAKVAGWNAAYLTSLWSLDPHVALDIRYVTDPAARRVRCYVIARVTGTAQAAHEQAAIVQRRLVMVPRHIAAAPISDDLLRSVLTSYNASGQRTIAAIRKRVTSMHANRPDAHSEGFTQYVNVLPFADVPQSWEYLFQRLCDDALPATTLSVSLASRQTTPKFMDFCGKAATAFAKYGAQLDDSRAGSLYESSLSLFGEPFAQEASNTFMRARRRYTDRLFQLRISVASESPLPPGLVEMIGLTISPREVDRTATYLEATVGPLYDIVEHSPDNQVLADEHLRLLSFPQELVDHPAFAAWPSQGQWAGSHGHLRFLAAVVDPREAASVAALPMAPHGFLPGFPVEPPGLPTRVFEQGSGPSIVVGHQLVAGRELNETVSVPLDSLTAHTLVAGTTGSGKTSAVLSLLHQLWAPAGEQRRVPFLVIEPVNSDRNDYRWLLDQPGFEDLVVFTLGDEACAPFRLNPFEVAPGVHIRTHVANLLNCFDTAFGLWDPLPQIYQRALNETYLAKGFSLSAVGQPSDAGRWPRLIDFVEAMARETESLDYSGEVRSNIVAASRVRVESIALGPCAESLDVGRSFPIEHLLARPTVLELGRLGGNRKEQAFVIALVLNAMTEHYMATRHSSELAHVTVVEEAHRLLPNVAPASGGQHPQGDTRAQAAEAFAGTLAENRKYGEALVLVEQIPSKLIADAFKNTSLKIMHRLPGADDRRVLGETMDFRPDHEVTAGTLQTFECLVKHPGIDAPAVARVANIRSGSAERALPGPDPVRKRHAETVAAEPGLAAALGPFKGCDGCCHRCEYRSTAHSIAQGRDAQQRFGQLWINGREIAKDNNLPAGTRWNTPAYDGWWADLRQYVDSLGGPRPAPTDAEAQGDFDACMLLHLWWTRWHNEPTQRFMGYFRNHAGSSGH